MRARITTRTWVAGGVATCLMVVAATWSLGVAPQREEAAGLREEVAATASSNDTLTARVDELALGAEGLPSTRARLQQLRAQMPADAALPELVRQVDALAAASGADLTGVVPTEPVAAAAAGSDPAATATGADGTVTSQGATEVPVTITATGTYDDVHALLRSLQVSLDRALLVRSITLTQGADAGVELSAETSVFFLPTSAAAEDAAAGDEADVEVAGDPDAEPLVTAAGATETTVPSSDDEPTAGTSRSTSTEESQ